MKNLEIFEFVSIVYHLLKSYSLCLFQLQKNNQNKQQKKSSKYFTIEEIIDKSLVCVKV